MPLWPCLAILAAGLAVIQFDSALSHWATSLKLGGDVRRELEVAQQFGDLTSMPSSHTLFAAALAAFVACAYPRLRGLVAVLVVIVGIARVVMGAHYPCDVLVGGAVGWFAGTLGMRLVYRWRERRSGGTSAR